MITLRKKKTDRYDNICPIDYRYAPEGMAKEILSEKARISYQLQVEAALAKGLAKYEVCTKKIAEEIADACSRVKPEEVYKEEEKTQNDIRALVNCIRARVSSDARPYVHLGATSEDIKQTAESLRLRAVSKQILIPEMMKLEKALISLALTHKETLQVGRTHGRHGVPITFGFAVSGYVSRLGRRIKKLGIASGNLKGMMSGTVGAHNSFSLFVDDVDEFEKDVLKYLGLKRSAHSTQIMEPEFMADFCHAIVSAFGVLANLADDLRHLQRTEIAEVSEDSGQRQAGQQPVPGRKIPMHFENIKSLYKEFMPRMVTLYLDQISEHQRDLTNSASSRFVPELVAAFLYSVRSMERHISGLMVDAGKMKENFMISKDCAAAEPIYVVFSLHKHPDAYEYVRHLVSESQRSKVSLKELLLNDSSASKYVKRFTKKQMEIINDPEKYIGDSREKVDYVCQLWTRRLKL